MGEIGETMVMAMQGSSLEGGERTLLEFLRDGMDGVARVERRRSLKERLGLTRFGCCGAHWGFGFGFGFGPIVLDDDDDESPQQQPLIPTPAPAANTCDGNSPVGANADVAEAAGMNLAAALAAERQFRAAQDSDGELSPGPSPSPMGLEISGTDIGPTQNRRSLMRLLHETECEELEGEDREKVTGCDMACCVCMGRKKGAAFIPCGHTFCRVCSRELWLNRGSCPLCNRPILEILDIF